MTPTTSERDRFEMWAKDSLSLVKEPGGYKEAVTYHAWRAWQAALTREQREGVCEACGMPKRERGLPPIESCACATLVLRKPQQEAQGAVAWCNDPECGCKEPTFTEPMEALRFLSGRMKYAGISKAVARHYARDIDAILASTPPAPVDVREKYDDVLLPFLALMRKELHANAGKGDRPGWLSMDRKTSLLELYYHLSKLQKAMKDDNAEGIREYAADVANMAMMAADICGQLDAALLDGQQEKVAATCGNTGMDSPSGSQGLNSGLIDGQPAGVDRSPAWLTFTGEPQTLEELRDELNRTTPQRTQAQQKIIAYQYHNTLTFAEEADDFMRNEGTPLISALDGQPAGVQQPWVCGFCKRTYYENAICCDEQRKFRERAQAALGGGGGRG